MASSNTYGYRYGTQLIVKYPLDSSTAAIAIGRAVTASGATSGYFKEVDAAAEPVAGFCAASVLAPSADGDGEVEVDVSFESVYEFPADAGTVDTTLLGKSCDIGATGRNVDINGSTTDDLQIVGINTERNTVYVRRLPAGITGVS